MINNIFPFVLQAASQSATTGFIAGPFQAATVWIDNEITLLVLGY